VKPRAPRRSVDDPAPPHAEKVRGVRLQPERPLKGDTAAEMHGALPKAKSYSDSHVADRDRRTWVLDQGLQRPWMPAYAPSPAREAFAKAEGLGTSSSMVKPPPISGGSGLPGNPPLSEASASYLQPYEQASPVPWFFGSDGPTGQTSFDSAVGSKFPRAGPAKFMSNGSAAAQGLRREPPPLPEQCFGMLRDGGMKSWMSEPPTRPSYVNSWSTCEVTPFGQLAVE
jgi:hypothetical protein